MRGQVAGLLVSQNHINRIMSDNINETEKAEVKSNGLLSYPSIFLLIALFIYAFITLRSRDLLPNPLFILFDIRNLDHSLNYKIFAVSVLVTETLVVLISMRKFQFRILPAVLIMNIVSTAFILSLFYSYKFQFRMEMIFMTHLIHPVVLPAIVFILFYTLYIIKPPRRFMVIIAWALATIIVPALIFYLDSLDQHHQTTATSYYFGYQENYYYGIIVFSFLFISALSIMIESWICYLFRIKNFWYPLLIANLFTYLIIVITLINRVLWLLKETKGVDIWM